MSDMYTKHASKYGEVVKENIYNALLERPSTMAMLDNLSGKRVIDMGCGSGIYTEWFLTQGVESATCIDASTDMVELVKAKMGDQVNAYVQDLSLGLPNEADNSADVIVCPLVLHYIDDLKPVFQEVYRVLKPEGYMVLSTHHPFADFECSVTKNYFDRELIEEEWNTVGEPVTVRFFRRSLTEITEAISASGLAISKISEGEVDERAKAISEDTYHHLKANPNFIFIRCDKLR